MLCKLLVVVLIALVIAACILFVGCSHRKFGHHYFTKFHDKKGDWIVKKISKELNLNENQKNELNRIKDEITAKHQEMKSTKKDMFNTVLVQIKAENIDKEKLNQLFEDKHLHMEKLKPFIIEKFTEFHDILTPEQRTKLAEKMTEFHNKMDH